MIPTRFRENNRAGMVVAGDFATGDTSWGVYRFLPLFTRDAERCA
jgi:hypothetical protein